MSGIIAGIGFRIIAGKVLGKAANAGGSALKWLGSLDLMHALALMLALFGGWQTGGRWMQHRHTVKVEAQLAKTAAALTAERNARMADRAAYAKAQTDAAQANKTQVASTEQQYKRISDNEKDAYARDRAELVRLRQQRDAAAQGASGAAGPSQDHTAAAGADGHAVPIPPGDDLQTKDDAADIELRLMHLQNYVEGLLKIDPNAGTAAPSRPVGD